MLTTGAMLAEWLAPLSIADFARAYLHRSAWALPQSATSARAIFDWDVLGDVLKAAAPTHVSLYARGHALPLSPPRDHDQLRGYMRMGIGACVRHGERYHGKLAGLARQFEYALQGAAHVQIVVAPRGSRCLGWHYQAEDVFVAQTAGTTDYYFRENTVEARAAFPPPDFTAVHAERSPLQNATLVPGDFLYIPARWWHMVVCRDDSLAISVCVLPLGPVL